MLFGGEAQVTRASCPCVPAHPAQALSPFGCGFPCARDVPALGSCSPSTAPLYLGDCRWDPLIEANRLFLPHCSCVLTPPVLSSPGILSHGFGLLLVSLTLSPFCLAPRPFLLGMPEKRGPENSHISEVLGKFTVFKVRNHLMFIFLVNVHFHLSALLKARCLCGLLFLITVVQ